MSAADEMAKALRRVLAEILAGAALLPENRRQYFAIRSTGAAIQDAIAALAAYEAERKQKEEGR